MRTTTLGLLLLAFAGYFKGAPGLAWIPVDITLIGAGIVAVTVGNQLIGALLKGTELPRGLGTVIWLWLAFLSGIPFGQWNPYARDKVLDLATLVPLAILGGMFLLRGTAARAHWLKLTVILGFGVVALALVFPYQDPGGLGRFGIDGGNTISAGRAVGAAAVVLAITAMSTRKHRFWAVAGALVLAGATVDTASRGPLLATLAAILAAGVAAGGGPRRLVGLAVAGVGAFLAVFLAARAGLVPARLVSLGDNSAQARAGLWEESAELIDTTPMGVGWGSLYVHLPPDLLLASGWAQYPHNIVLEVFTEGGWIAGTVFVVAVVVALRRQRRAATGLVEKAMLGLLVFHVTNAMVSGDISANRGMWVALGAALILPVLQDAAPDDTRTLGGAHSPKAAEVARL
ncbi:O-antigen ligase family protein [Georgenia thermotolerans]|uniref:O-antigen ligase family protein n=1 Tax=Georgenia thermotolerans TaxID=527326 RepID=UPI0012658622|nr:O-antigen ligase family protein [Georgenia thermotolerans]